MENNFVLVIKKIWVGILFLSNICIGGSDEKLLFFDANPKLTEHAKLFAKTSIEREIQVLG